MLWRLPIFKGSLKSDRKILLIGNDIEPEKSGKSGVNNGIYQTFYSIPGEDI